MKSLIVAAIVGSFMGMAAAQVQFPPEPYPGQHNHDAPPAGWFCQPNAPDPAHECHCSGMVPDPMCPKPPNGENDEEGDNPSLPPEDAHCTTYCHRDHCKCSESCEDSRNKEIPPYDRALG